MSSINLTDAVTVAVTVRVSHALAGKIGGRAGDEQLCLVGVLDGLIRQIEVERATGAATGRPTR